MATPVTMEGDLGYAGNPVERMAYRGTVPAGSSVVVMLDNPTAYTAVAVYPAGTALIETTLDSYADIVGDTATWIAWASGTVSQATEDLLTGPAVALRCTAATGDAELRVTV
jgi:hypothetical protein